MVQRSRSEVPFFQSSMVIWNGAITHQLAKRTTEHMLASVGVGDEPINVIISSTGEHVESGDMAHNMIKSVRPKVHTIGNGWVASEDALIFVGAELEDGYCSPNTLFLVQQLFDGIGGSTSDMEIQAEQIRHIRSWFDYILTQAKGQTIARIRAATQPIFGSIPHRLGTMVLWVG